MPLGKLASVTTRRWSVKVAGELTPTRTSVWVASSRLERVTARVAGKSWSTGVVYQTSLAFVNWLGAGPVEATTTPPRGAPAPRRHRSDTTRVLTAIGGE